MERGNLARVNRRVLSRTSPSVLAPRPVWGPRCGRTGTQVSATRQVTRARLGETKRWERIEGQDRLACSQSPHDETVVARCAQYETVLPLALKSKLATGHLSWMR